MFVLLFVGALGKKWKYSADDQPKAGDYNKWYCYWIHFFYIYNL